MRLMLMAALAALSAAAPAAAQRGPSQYERGYHPWHTARSEAISAGTVAETADANRRAAARIDSGWRVDEARYARDLVAYRAEVRARHRAGVREQRAYSMAMDDWHAQVEACERGDRRACEAPSPDPADYL